MTGSKKKKPVRRVILQGYGKIRGFLKEAGFDPPPVPDTLRDWAKRRGCPIKRAMGTRRVYALAHELLAWVRSSYLEQDNDES